MRVVAASSTGKVVIITMVVWATGDAPHRLGCDVSLWGTVDSAVRRIIIFARSIISPAVVALDVPSYGGERRLTGAGGVLGTSAGARGRR